MEEEEIIHDKPDQEIDKPVSSEELNQFLSDKFDEVQGPVERKLTIPERFAILKNRRF